ncbi:glycosyltransferase [Pseudoxanthomonas sp. PXM02]|uniref:glycosyltransferase n=1 Tax=Pseudoxanthomonas sp. PXM02 TaxID=2769294 RepID=UPI00178723DE|nr:glycosyltransferase [Pseudoxanthomonas sp. PXM02]MBD9479343.1 glycosyltransferase [Pseudoxanthomonas sp. PXM02]
MNAGQGRLRILLAAYEFSPSPSAQSLRWAYLVRELAKQGHEIHVMAPDAYYGRMSLHFDLPPVVQVHRIFAGPSMGLVARASRRQQTAGRQMPSGGGVAKSSPAQGEIASPAPIGEWRIERPNWKGRLLAFYQRHAGRWLFPDIRGEWSPWATRAFRRLLDELSPDAVITSHEPASVLRLGILAQREGIPWIADLGDPVLADYTPVRWRRHARRLERTTCERASAVVVTDASARDLLGQRYAQSLDRIHVISQGYPSSIPREPSRAGADAPLSLVYTGSLYPFRPIEPLLDAVLDMEGVILHVATASPSPALEAAAGQGSLRVVHHGHLGHGEALALQAQADIVVDIGNRLSAQLPGKIYEYFASARPILHLNGGDGDPAPALLDRLRRGWSCDNNTHKIRGLLSGLAVKKRNGHLCSDLDLAEERVLPFRWDSLALSYSRVIEHAVHVHGGTTRHHLHLE